MEIQKRSLEDLINSADPAWPLVQQWLRDASNQVEVLPSDRRRGETVLFELQVTTRSPLGAMALETGGLLIDHGWLRFLGSGHERICGNLHTWNSSGAILESHLIEGGLIVAYDVLGGFFAINVGVFPGKMGNVFYFAPDNLQWEDTENSYSNFLSWALSGDLATFYQTLRWPAWNADISALTGDQGISIYPFLFVKKGGSIAERSRRPVPMYELWHLHLDLAEQIGHLPPGTAVEFGIEKDLSMEE